MVIFGHLLKATKEDMRLHFLSSLCLAILLQLSLVSSAQTEFNLVGGQQLNAKIISETETEITFEIAKKNDKTKTKKIAKSRLFSTVTNGLETIHYNPEEGNIHYSKDDMRYYVYGQQDAYQYYKTTWTVIVAGVMGGVAGVWMGSEGSALLILAPVVGTIGGTLVQKHEPKPELTRSKSYLKEPAYVLGYKKTARSKKIFNSIKSAVVGTLVGGAVGLALYDPN